MELNMLLDWRFRAQPINALVGGQEVLGCNGAAATCSRRISNARPAKRANVTDASLIEPCKFKKGQVGHNGRTCALVEQKNQPPSRVRFAIACVMHA